MKQEQVHIDYDLPVDVKQSNFDKFPCSNFVRIESTYKMFGSVEKKLTSSGFLLNDYQVLTCAHNVYNDDGQGASDIKIIQIGNKNVSEIASIQIIPPNFKQKENVEQKRKYDFAILKLSNKLSQVKDVKFGQPIKNQDASMYTFQSKEKKLKECKGKIYYFDKQFLEYNIYGQRGQSGSPIINLNNQVLGIHKGMNHRKGLTYGININHINQFLSLKLKQEE